MNLFAKQKQTHRLKELNGGCKGGKWGGGVVREFGMDMYTLLHLKCISNRDLPYNKGNSAQCSEAAWIGGESGREWIQGYVWLSPFAVPLKLSHHCYWL